MDYFYCNLVFDDRRQEPTKRDDECEDIHEGEEAKVEDEAVGEECKTEGGGDGGEAGEGDGERGSETPD